ncbi:hypothetical protein TREES_T100016844 [Tupaia chinensis]|uniref:Uncharacterized protein n=1 Tax=Tupaia chinensis TaxID=246437 RepID=L9KZ53_TUPCH|nr:hypothetical protein TREES_T100016844 [Tupaia chinensis]
MELTSESEGEPVPARGSRAHQPSLPQAGRPRCCVTHKPDRAPAASGSVTRHGWKVSNSLTYLLPSHGNRRRGILRASRAQAVRVALSRSQGAEVLGSGTGSVPCTTSSCAFERTGTRHDQVPAAEPFRRLGDTPGVIAPEDTGQRRQEGRTDSRSPTQHSTEVPERTVFPPHVTEQDLEGRELLVPAELPAMSWRQCRGVYVRWPQCYLVTTVMATPLEGETVCVQDRVPQQSEGCAECS